ncbi:MAG: cysteine desulfurase [Chlorobiaceae bacterium]|nr:cysteine desulfurase [Chlorobiaceae bacterium]
MQGINQGKCLVEELFHRAGNTLANPQEPLVASREGLSVPLQDPGSFYFLEQLPKPQAQREIFDVASVRRDFPILGQKVHGRPLVWLDNAATTQKPLSVIEAISQFYATDNSNIHRGAHTLAARATDAYEGAREKIRRFINAGSTSEIVYVRGTTEAINLVAQTWGRSVIQPGDEIVLSILEHHANIVPWQMLAREKGAVIRVIPVDDNGEILLEEYTRLLGPRTRLVSITQASNGLGTILPVREMIRLARRHNATVLVDGAQSVAHIPVDVQDLDADFFVFSGHKIFAPTGIGVLYGKRELLESMPPWQGGGNMIRDVRFDRTIYNETPAKFEAGTPSIADAVGLGAALDYVRKLGLENIARYEHELTRYATRQLSTIPGLRLIGTAREKVGVLSFVLDGIPNDEVGRLLDREGIAVRTGHHCTQPSLRRFGVEGTVRPSLAFYNTAGEIDRLVDVVRRLRRS